MSGLGRCAMTLAVALSLLVIGCQDATEGCLDYRALAIDVTVDRACDGCCDYPTLQLQLVPRAFAGDSLGPIVRAGALLTASPDTVTLAALNFFISELQLVLADGTTRTLTDTLTVRRASDGVGEVREVSLLRVGPLRTIAYSTGTLLENLTVTGLRLRVGLDEALAAEAAAGRRQPGRLAIGTDSLYDRSARQLLDAYLAFGTAPGDSTPVEVRVAGGASVPVDLPFPAPIDLPTGYNLQVTVALPVDEVLTLLSAERVTAEDLADAVLRRAVVTGASTGR